MPSLAVISFPGNNCDSESVRAARRNGFTADLVLWNELEKIGSYDAYFLTGGFSFEDRGRSGSIAAREPIFDALREEAKQGKVILGVCNGAQMIVESGLIPVGDNPVPFALADNIRRDTSGKVLGTGYYNVWSYIKAERTDTAFTCGCQPLLAVPIAHGEGRFTSVDDESLQALKSGSHVAFRYADADGNVSADFPVTPNGANFAVAMLVNKEGTIGAIMPHPERFYDECDGDQIFQSMKQWIEEKRSPASVPICDFSRAEMPAVKSFTAAPNALILEKKLIITDNEAFSISQTASSIAGEDLNLEKSTVFEIVGDKLNQAKILNSGLILNPNKEVDLSFHLQSCEQKYGVLPLENDEADHLAAKLSNLLGSTVKVRMLTAWDFGNASKSAVDKVLQNRLLANPNSAELVKL